MIHSERLALFGKQMLGLFAQEYALAGVELVIPHHQQGKGQGIQGFVFIPL